MQCFSIRVTEIVLKEKERCEGDWTHHGNKLRIGWFGLVEGIWQKYKVVIDSDLRESMTFHQCCPELVYRYR